MNKLKYITLSLLSILALSSCEYDNYDEPKEVFRGKIIDRITKAPVQTGNGYDGIRIRMFEYSWDQNPLPQDLWSKNDGTFQNIRMFAGDYGVQITGPFVPVTEKKVTIKGTTEKVFEVEPLLNIEWVGEPEITNTMFEVRFKITRGTANPEYQQAVKTIWLSVNENQYVDWFRKNANLSSKLEGVNVNDVIGKVITIRSGRPDGPDGGFFPMPDFKRKLFIRIAARTDIKIDGAEKWYNYSTTKEITTLGE